MLSEWMKAVPEDLATHWSFVVCPKARRCLVVAAKGVTTAYRRNGKKLSRFPSALPGGSRRQRASSKDYTILDCLMDEPSKTFYVLDCMAWHGHEVCLVVGIPEPPVTDAPVCRRRPDRPQCAAVPPTDRPRYP